MIFRRILLSLIERINADMAKLKNIAKMAGIVFPDVGTGPPRSGVHVPRIGRTITDSLHYTNAENVFPVPDLSQFMDLLPDDGARKGLGEALEAYRKSVRDQFVKLYDVSASNLNASDDLLIFYTE